MIKEYRTIMETFPALPLVWNGKVGINLAHVESAMPWPTADNALAVWVYMPASRYFVIDEDFGAFLHDWRSSV